MRAAAGKIRPQHILLSIVFVLLLLVGHTAYWLHTTIYNTERFTEISTQTIGLESSRQSIGTAVTDRVLADRPIARQIAGDRLSGLIAGLIGTDLAQSAIEELAERGHLLVTTPQREPISFDVSGIKQYIVTLQSVAGTTPETQRLDVSQIPDQITIVDTKALPNIHQYGIAALWVGVLSAMTLFGGALWYVARGGDALRLLRLRVVLTLVIIGCGIALLVGPLTRPVFLMVAQNAPEQTLLRNVFDGFIAPFNAQAKQLAAVAAIGLGATLLAPTLSTNMNNQKLSKRKATIT
jgi:hypothetical protein